MFFRIMNIFYILITAATFFLRLFQAGIVPSLTALLVIALLVGLPYLFYLVRFPLTDKLRFTANTFLMFSFFLGNIWRLYYLIWWWDFALHLFSGFMLAVFGYCFLYMLSGYKKEAVTSFGFAATFVFMFCISAAGVWEMYEFAGDILFGLKSQTGSLIDTMTDIIAGTLGGIPMIVMLICAKHGRKIRFIEKLICDIDACRASRKTSTKKEAMDSCRDTLSAGKEKTK